MKPSVHTKKQPTTSIGGRCDSYQPRLFAVPVAVRGPDGRIDKEAASKRCDHRFIDLLERRGILPMDIASQAHVDVENGESCLLRLIPYIPRRAGVA